MVEADVCSGDAITGWDRAARGETLRAVAVRCCRRKMTRAFVSRAMNGRVSANESIVFFFVNTGADMLKCLVISGDDRKRKDNVAVTRVSSFRRGPFTNAGPGCSDCRCRLRLLIGSRIEIHFTIALVCRRRSCPTLRGSLEWTTRSPPLHTRKDVRTKGQRAM
jgi:hypothetical protein